MRLTGDRALRDSMGEKGLGFVAAHRGAVDRIAGWIAAISARRSVPFSVEKGV